MMMFGGSPTSVAAPPMLDANTSAIRNGAALMASRSQTSSVTGAISSTVVTLSSSAEATAVTSTSRIMIRSGEPLARLADQIAAYSNTPVWRRTLTMIIIPSSRNDVPVDSGVAGVEDVIGCDDAEGDQDRRSGERDNAVIDTIAGDQRVPDHENRDRDDGHEPVSASVLQPVGEMR